MGNNILTKELLLKSVEEWNAARKANPDNIPDLRKASLREANLSGANLRKAELWNANLKRAKLSGADLSEAFLRGANLCKADLRSAKLNGTDLIGADLTEANLCGAELNGADLDRSHLKGANLSDAELWCAGLRLADLKRANLSRAQLADSDLSTATLDGADLTGANLYGANLNWAILNGINLNDAEIGFTTFGDVDLSSVIGLDTIQHRGPSTIGIDTLFASKGNIPEVFLRGCGVPDSFIEYARSLTAKAFDYYSCFISHSTADKDFADRLYADLQAKGVRCWYAPHDMEGGEHIDTQIDRAIKVHEKLLLVLSESSINSNWVKREISKAVNREDKEGKRVLFPISLVEFSKIEEWEFVDSKGRDLSEEIRKFSIPSFKGWEHDNAIYTTEFPKLLKAFQDKSKL